MLDCPAVSTLTLLWFLIFFALEAYINDIRLFTDAPTAGKDQSGQSPFWRNVSSFIPDFVCKKHNQLMNHKTNVLRQGSPSSDSYF